MLFVPPGCGPLTVAVDRLAEARRTARQTNDDGRNAARAELRSELYNRSMLATVICPRSGKTHTIRPHYWALEEATTWFEQGECWLTEYLVDPPLGMLYGKERVTIFVSEHDLQSLMAKQEVKQQAAPRLDVKELCPKSPPLSAEPLNHVENPEQTRPVKKPQSERAERYIEKNFQGKTDGITTKAIHDALCKDTELHAELKRLGRRAVPSPTVIDRVLGRRKN